MAWLLRWPSLFVRARNTLLGYKIISGENWIFMRSMLTPLPSYRSWHNEKWHLAYRVIRKRSDPVLPLLMSIVYCLFCNIMGSIMECVNRALQKRKGRRLFSERECIKPVCSMYTHIRTPTSWYWEAWLFTVYCEKRAIYRPSPSIVTDNPKELESRTGTTRRWGQPWSLA